jgi:hypothetical protein
MHSLYQPKKEDERVINEHKLPIVCLLKFLMSRCNYIRLKTEGNKRTNFKGVKKEYKTKPEKRIVLACHQQRESLSFCICPHCVPPTDFLATYQSAHTSICH